MLQIEYHVEGFPLPLFLAACFPLVWNISLYRLVSSEQIIKINNHSALSIPQGKLFTQFLQGNKCTLFSSWFVGLTCLISYCRCSCYYCHTVQFLELSLWITLRTSPQNFVLFFLRYWGHYSYRNYRGKMAFWSLYFSTMWEYQDLNSLTGST